MPLDLPVCSDIRARGGVWCVAPVCGALGSLVCRPLAPHTAARATLPGCFGGIGLRSGIAGLKRRHAHERLSIWVGPAVDDVLTGAMVTTLTDGGQADALHSHAAQNYSRP